MHPFSFSHSVFLLQSTLDALLCYTTTRIWARGTGMGRGVDREAQDSVGPFARKPLKIFRPDVWCYMVKLANTKVQKQKLWIKCEAFTECFENSPAESSDASVTPSLQLCSQHCPTSPFSPHSLPPQTLFSVSSSLCLSPFPPPPRRNA